MAELSKEAQAVYDAYCKWADDPHYFEHIALIAALRAAVDQVVPEQALEDVPGRFVNACCHEQRQSTRRQLLAIAAELEGE